MTSDQSDNDLYLTSLEKGSYFNRMLHGGDKFNMWAEIALRDYLPKVIFHDLKEDLSFFCGSHADGSHIPKSVVGDREIIIISERVLPPSGTRAKDPDGQNFIKIIFHEVAHAYLKHKSQFFDQLTQEQADQQEVEANELAYKWLDRKNISPRV